MSQRSGRWECRRRGNRQFGDDVKSPHLRPFTRAATDCIHVPSILIMISSLFPTFRPTSHYLSLLLLTAFLWVAATCWAQAAPVFSQIVVFGDSLSDDGNVRHVMEDQYFSATLAVISIIATGVLPTAPTLTRAPTRMPAHGTSSWG